MDVHLPLTSPAAVCDHLRPVRVSADSSIAYCPDCLPSSGWRIARYPRLDPDLIDFYEQRSRAYDALPPHNPSCERVFEDGRPVITSPVEGLTYYLYPGSGRIQLACRSPGDVAEVYWYVDDVFVGSGPPSERRFVDPRPGRMKISCTDDKGRNEDVTIQIDRI